MIKALNPVIPQIEKVDPSTGESNIVFPSASWETAGAHLAKSTQVPDRYQLGWHFYPWDCVKSPLPKTAAGSISEVLQTPEHAALLNTTLNAQHADRVQGKWSHPSHARSTGTARQLSQAAGGGAPLRSTEAVKLHQTQACVPSDFTWIMRDVTWEGPIEGICMW